MLDESQHNTSVASSLHAEVSISTTRPEVAESETSADELTSDDKDTSTSFGKRARRKISRLQWKNR